ncbi:hypothetical protein EDD37DRAFT_378499 [Exophiala viscosa]|uniref:uncharacterized protein n=1 Tax=Exophiala viscosa TaxID=2486360 RepID=UPI00219FCD19|nr:hypothetical protein EDD37DRAFT_378499 [Exophiala viscosa]
MSTDSPTNPITSGVATGRTVFDFSIDVADKVFEGPVQWVKNFYSRGSSARELKSRLGEWALEAQDNRGRWLQPVLSKDAFRSHLITEDGQMQPSGECTATFGWAKLLYALNIRPAGGIISWRETPEGESSALNTNKISLCVHGSVLCDIINLYRMYTDRPPTSAGIFQLPFGELKVLDEDNHSYAFKTFGNDVLSSPRQPFPYSMRDIGSTREGNLSFDKGVIITSYLQALEYDISTSALTLRDTHQPLAERVRRLLQGLARVCDGDWNKPLLVTPSWTKHASRIKRRATTDNGKNDRLSRHIFMFISQNKGVEAHLQRSKGDKWRHLIDQNVKAWFLSDGEEYKFVWDIVAWQRSSDGWEEFFKNELLPALEGLSQTTEGQHWLPDTVSPQDLYILLTTPHKILNEPVIVLEHLPDQWDFYGEISG